MLNVSYMIADCWLLLCGCTDISANISHFLSEQVSFEFANKNHCLIDDFVCVCVYINMCGVIVFMNAIDNSFY